MRCIGLALLAVPLLACSAVLHPEGNLIYCMGTGASDTCNPFGMMCVDGVCQAIVPTDGGTAPDGCGAQESCNGLDDNCNGLVDEDPASDRDHDAYSWCGTVSGHIPGPLSPDRVDCDDTDPTVWPGAPEVCDGKDNNCNHIVDEMVDCGAGQFCSMTVHACRPTGDCTLSENPCPTGQICDTASGAPHCASGSDCRSTPTLCVAPAVCNTTTGVCTTPQPLGSPCVEDSDCASGACFDALALRVLSPSPRICGQACCSDAQCTGGAICWTPGSGARSCMPASLIGRTSTGTAAHGASCGSGADCSSGLCGSSADGCIGACRSSAECPGAACGLTEPVTTGATDYRTLSCVSRSGSGHAGSMCCGDDECASGVCFGNDTFFGSCVPGACAEGCGTNADCSTPAWTGGTGYCGYLAITDGTGTSVALPMCFYRLPGMTASGTTGTACTANRTCASNFCDTSTGVCRDTCCSDVDCQPSGTKCRPGTGTYATMRCR